MNVNSLMSRMEFRWLGRSVCSEGIADEIFHCLGLSRAWVETWRGDEWAISALWGLELTPDGA